jgi:hypothetical protein
MKEKCEKLFHIGEIYYALFIILIFAISVIITVLSIVLRLGAVAVAIVFAVFIAVDLFSFFAYRTYRKSAYYVEVDGDKAVFYVTGGSIEKNVADCKRIIRTGFELFLIFNDGKIRLCKFHGCPGVTDCISSENFPNAK